MMITEEQVASKVSELMETLYQVKKYKAIAGSLKKFILIVGGSFALFLALLTIGYIYKVDHVLSSTMFSVATFLTLLIPLSGLVCGILYTQKQVNDVKEGNWRPEISKGFSSTLKLLTDMDWEKTLDDIAIARLGYAIYSLLKTCAYLVISVAAFEFAWNSLTLIFLHELVPVGALFWGFLAVLIVVFALYKDLLKRYLELRALDMLVWELRWFSVEFKRAEF
jgi:hypothetical protein